MIGAFESWQRKGVHLVLEAGIAGLAAALAGSALHVSWARPITSIPRATRGTPTNFALEGIKRHLRRPV